MRKQPHLGRFLAAASLMTAACGAFSGSAGGVESQGDAGSAGDTGDAASAPDSPASEASASDATGASDGATGAGDASAAKCAWDSPFTSAHRIAELDTAAGEGTPRLSPDERTIYFWRNTALGVSDLFFATRSDRSQPFGLALAITELDTAHYEQDPVLTSDGLTIFFASDRDRGGVTVDQIYVATRASASAQFGAAAPLAIHSPTAANEYGPYLSPLRGDLWFTRDGAIYVASNQGGGSFASPSAVTAINAIGSVSYAVVSSDELTVYVATSTGEIHVAHRNAPNVDFAAAPTLVTELGPLFADGGFGDTRPSWLSPDGCRLYAFSFDATAQGEHMYVAERAPL